MLSFGSMAGFRVNFLLTVLTGNLLLVSVRAWEPIDDNKLRSFYETGEWTDPQYIKLPGNALVRGFLLHW